MNPSILARCLIGLVLLLLASCSGATDDSPPVASNDSPPVATVDAIDEFGVDLAKSPDDRLQDVRELQEFKVLAALVQKADKVILYEGLPHQMWEREALADELKSKKTVTFHKFPFYREWLELKEADAREITSLFSKPESFVVYAGSFLVAKGCGGFHPDYYVEWHYDDQVCCHALICFGCHEMKAFAEETELQCDIAQAAYERLKDILEPYHRNRPLRKK